MCKSEVNRLILSGEHYPTVTLPGQEWFVVDVPTGYRVVSAGIGPAEDGNYATVVASFTLSSHSVEFFCYYPNSTGGQVAYTVICERSDEPDVDIDVSV